ncbi:phosphodiester glycosidase family protein [Candidatus Uhrbacteria bacterium]|nr:phosphodiester glycosidase family protein [Candidatus Uhrbacteria bacterium]
MMYRQIITLLILLLGISALPLTAHAHDEAPWRGPRFSVETRTHAGKSFRIFHGGAMDFTTTRPQHTNTRVLLMVAGTYTSPQNTAEGHIIDHGTAQHRTCDLSCRNWNAVAIIESGYVRIMRQDAEALERSRLLTEVIRSRGSLIQGHLLVEHGVPIRGYARGRPYHRRALATMDDRLRIGDIIESAQPHTSLSDFAKHLAALGYRNAINLDMGAWDEGWYRDPNTGTIHPIGQIRTATNRQTNWIIIRK